VSLYFYFYLPDALGSDMVWSAC